MAHPADGLLRYTFENLGIFLIYQHFHHHQGGQDSVTGRRVLAENDVAGLLSAERIAVCHHVLAHVFVADCRLLIPDTGAVTRFVKTEV